MKIGIITFNNAYNYGAILQCYALQTFLKQNNICNEVIDYQCDYINKRYKSLIRIVKGKELKSFIGSLIKMANKIKGLRLFEQFQNRFITKTAPITRKELEKISCQYDAFLVGSDQVWSPTCAGFDSTYFLDFADASQKYSYAASFGTDSLTSIECEEYRALLNDFRSYSVREKSGAKLIEQILDKKAQVHIDPTLLLNRETWDELADSPLFDKPYIFVFSVQKPKDMLTWARDFGTKKNLPVYYLNDKHLPLKGIKYIKNASPDQFVSLIKNAEYIVTNSFHGVAFSIIYHKKFIVEFDSLGSKNIRAEELLKKLHIQNREISSEVLPDQPIDWICVEKCLEEERGLAKEYLMGLDLDKAKRGM